MIDYDDKSKKVELHLKEHVNDNIFIQKKEKIEEQLNAGKKRMLNSLKEFSTEFNRNEIKGDKVAWSFRVLLNNLLFIGGLVVVSSMMAPTTTYDKQKNLLTTTYSENGQTEYIAPLSGIKNPTLNAIIQNDYTFFRSLSGINYNEKINYQQNGKFLSISPLELAVIYNRVSFVQFMLSKQPALNASQTSVSTFQDLNNMNYNILNLPQVNDFQNKDNFGFESKTLLINKGMNIGYNNYEIFRKTIHMPEWKNFWKNYFLQKNNTALYRSLLISELGDKQSLLNDLNKMK